jgi:hypothetical protein
MLSSINASFYTHRPPNFSDLLDAMQKRASKWMSAIKEAHTTAFAKASKGELMDALDRLDMLFPTSFMIKDTFLYLLEKWPERSICSRVTID